MKLGPRQKQWVEDIPQYEQAYETLCDGRGLCCLGVYAHTQVSEPWEITDAGKWYYSREGDPASTTLFKIDWENLGLRDWNGMFWAMLTWKNVAYESLVALNDSRRITPEEMAQFIQDNADNIFTRAA